jgi:hypothetical protein
VLRVHGHRHRIADVPHERCHEVVPLLDWTGYRARVQVEGRWRRRSFSGGRRGSAGCSAPSTPRRQRAGRGARGRRWRRPIAAERDRRAVGFLGGIPSEGVGGCQALPALPAAALFGPLYRYCSESPADRAATEDGAERTCGYRGRGHAVPASECTIACEIDPAADIATI